MALENHKPNLEKKIRNLVDMEDDAEALQQNKNFRHQLVKKDYEDLKKKTDALEGQYINSLNEHKQLERKMKDHERVLEIEKFTTERARRRRDRVNEEIRETNIPIRRDAEVSTQGLNSIGVQTAEFIPNNPLLQQNSLASNGLQQLSINDQVRNFRDIFFQTLLPGYRNLSEIAERRVGTDNNN